MFREIIQYWHLLSFAKIDTKLSDYRKGGHSKYSQVNAEQLQQHAVSSALWSLRYYTNKSVID